MINITLTIDQINVISAALSEGPYRLVAPILAILSEQVADQQWDREDRPNREIAEQRKPAERMTPRDDLRTAHG